MNGKEAGHYWNETLSRVIDSQTKSAGSKGLFDDVQKLD
jgi:hypothetical protein